MRVFSKLDIPISYAEQWEYSQICMWKESCVYAQAA